MGAGDCFCMQHLAAQIFVVAGRGPSGERLTWLSGSRILAEGPILCIARVCRPEPGPRLRLQRQGRRRCIRGHGEGPRPSEAWSQPGQGRPTSAALSVAAAGTVAFVWCARGPQPGSQGCVAVATEVVSLAAEATARRPRSSTRRPRSQPDRPRSWLGPHRDCDG